MLYTRWVSSFFCLVVVATLQYSDVIISTVLLVIILAFTNLDINDDFLKNLIVIFDSAAQF